MKFISDQESKHWFVCRAQQTSKVFVINKFRLVIYQLWNCAGWQQRKHQCLHWCSVFYILGLQKCSVITGPLQDHMYRRSELKHKKFKPQISNITNNIMKTHRSQQNDFLYNFSTLIFTNSQTLLSSARKKSLTLNVLGNCPDTRTASYFA